MTDADSVWNTGATNPENPNCIKCEYAPAAYNVAQRFVANFEYELPFGRMDAFSHASQTAHQRLGGARAFSRRRPDTPSRLNSPYGTLAVRRRRKHPALLPAKGNPQPHRG